MVNNHTNVNVDNKKSPLNIWREKFYFGEFILLITSIVWGSSLIFQKNVTEIMGASFFSSVRFLIGFISLFICILSLHFWNNHNLKKKHSLKSSLKRIVNKKLVAFGSSAGFFLGVGALMQQLSLPQTTITKAGFITGLYIVFVPLIQMVFLQLRQHWLTWVATGLAFIGLYTVNMAEKGASEHWNIYDSILTISAVVWAIHILIIELAVRNNVNPLHLNACQSLFVAIMAGIYALIFEDIDLSVLINPIVIEAVLFTGVASSAVAYMLQIIGQKSVPSNVAALILSLEALFTAIFGWLVFNEVLSNFEMLGFGIMVVAVMIASIMPKPHRSN